ncbi:MAG: asparagine synthase (glutamine-hydrolyzing) [Crocinitomicaceae bacterium]|nr:asparagine synthase (glutamine-hydrolyzing) [Crocinitomicaceae bacterium]
MCGFIFGYKIALDDRFDPDLLKHRGPDYRGTWVSDTGYYFCGHRRLSIVDITASGNQPLFSKDRRWVFVYNGEIYNFKELRRDLEQKGVDFVSNSDSEVLFNGLIQFGEKFLNRCNGMFSFAIFDQNKNQLTVGRDRFGKKPLFYTLTDGGYVFASEMKALYPYLDSVSPNVEISKFFKNPFDYESTNITCIESIYSVKPGTILKLNGTVVDESRWWNTLNTLVDVPNKYNDQVDQFRNLFLNAVKIRMRSDVPIGTALSGGLDSSAVFCSMLHLIKNGETSSFIPRAFIAHYPGSDIDELYWARLAVGNRQDLLNVVEVNPLDNNRTLEEALFQVEDPYITLPHPMLATYKAIKKSGISVTLDGHGADEMFSGYNDLFLAMLSLDTVRLQEVNSISKSLNTGVMPVNVSKFKLINDALKAWFKFFARDARDIFRKDKYLSHEDLRHKNYRRMSAFERRLYVIFHLTILPTLLRNYDRYSMAESVEVRMPFMDHRLVSFVFSLPLSSKLGGGYTKRIVRDAMRDIVPEPILTRRDKIGWNAPLHNWLFGELGCEIDLKLKEDKNLYDLVGEDWTNFRRTPSPTFLDGQRVWQKLLPYLWNRMIQKIN